MAQDLDTARYARHLLLPEIGRAGQERLLAAHVHEVEGADAGALAVAREYLTRAGVKSGEENRQDARSAGGARNREQISVSDEDQLSLPGVPGALGVLAVSSLSAPAVALHVASASEIEALAGRAELREAARALSGALAAVECVKSVLGLGEAQSVAPPSLSSEEV